MPSDTSDEADAARFRRPVRAQEAGVVYPWFDVDFAKGVKLKQHSKGEKSGSNIADESVRGNITEESVREHQQ